MKIGGVDAEIIMEVAALECFEVDWQEVTFAAGYRACSPAGWMPPWAASTVPPNAHSC